MFLYKLKFNDVMKYNNDSNNYYVIINFEYL